MPYEIEKRGDEWCVVKEGGGKSMGCHDSEEKAQAQMRALYASEKKQRKSIRRIVADEIDRRLNPVKVGTDGTAFKVYTDADGQKRFLAVWTNNFVDREGEVFSEKAINDYVQRVEMGIVPPPELWVYHAGANTRVGVAEKVGGVGHFGIAAGVFDDTPRAKAAAKFYERHYKETSLSHGYTFLHQDLVDGVYDAFNTFEITLLPRGVEANLFTSLEGVKAMELSEATRDYLKRVFGGEWEGLEKDLNERGKAVESMGVGYKDFADTSSTGDGEDASAGDEDGSDPDGVKALIELGKQLIADNASLSAALAEKSAEGSKAVSAKTDELTAAIKEVKALADQFKAQLNDRPRVASKDAETEVDESDPIFAGMQHVEVEEQIAAVMPGLFNKNGKG